MADRRRVWYGKPGNQLWLIIVVVGITLYSLYQAMNPKATVNQKTLSRDLAKQDYELVDAAVGATSQPLSVQANKLQPVSVVGSDSLYVPLPVTLQVTMDAHNKVLSIDGGAPASGAVTDAEQFVKTLIANNQLSGLSEQPLANATHQIEVNDKGQRVIRRRHFSAY